MDKNAVSFILEVCMQNRKILVCALAAGMLGYAADAQAFSICIDPGHGGSDPGATGCSLQEAEINLNVSMRLRDLLKSAGHTVYMTRETDVYVSLSGRSEYANSKGVDTFASIHTNSAGSTSATGTETYAYSTSGKGYQQATNIQTEMQKVWPLANRGVKTANYYVIKYTNMPATLSELAFIVNCSKDAVYLGSSEHRQSAAAAHCKGLTQLWSGSASSACSGGGGSVTPPPASTGKVMGGSYLNEIKGAWLGGVTVQIGDQKTTSSVTENTFWSLNVPVGTFTLKASKSGYNTTTRSDCAAASASETVWCSFALTAAAQEVKNGTAKGTVKDSSNGSAIAAKVQVQGGASADYNGSGTWSFSLKPGTYTITGSADGYNSKDVQCAVASEKETDCSILLDPKSGTIVGSVYDADDKTPLAGVVKLDDKQVNYDGGQFSFTVPAGTYTVIAEVNDYETGSTSCQVGRGETKQCDVALKKKAVVPPSGAKGYINGELKDAVTDANIAGTLSLDDGQTFNYHGNGKWMFMLDPGNYAVTAQAEGYSDKKVTCTVTPETFTDCTIRLDPKPGSIAGHVTSGNAQVAATITITDASGNAVGGAIEYDGTAQWSADLETGTYNVTAEPVDTETYKTGTTTCTVEPGKSSECNIVLLKAGESGGSLKGTVTHEGVSTLTIEADVSIEGYPTVHYSGKNNEMWEMTGLASGTYQVYAHSDGYLDGNASCTVVDGETSMCHIGLTPISDTGATDRLEAGVLPQITVHTKSNCSAQTRSETSVPFGLLAAASGILAAFAVRRRRTKGEAK